MPDQKAKLMSQVIQCKDSHSKKREKSRLKEKQIDRNPQLKKWQRTDVTKTLTIEKVIGIIFLPIAFFWALIAALMTIGSSLALLSFKFCSTAWNLCLKKKINNSEFMPRPNS